MNKNLNWIPPNQREMINQRLQQSPNWHERMPSSVFYEELFNGFSKEDLNNSLVILELGEKNMVAQKTCIADINDKHDFSAFKEHLKNATDKQMILFIQDDYDLFDNFRNDLNIVEFLKHSFEISKLGDHLDFKDIIMFNSDGDIISSLVYENDNEWHKYPMRLLAEKLVQLKNEEDYDNCR